MFLCVAMGLAFAAGAEGQESYCPASISTRQAIENAPAGWAVGSDKTPHALAGLTFFDGPPEQEASLVYDSYTKGKTADHALWKFDPSLHIHLQCSYHGTSITLSRPLRDGTTECRVTYSRESHVDGYNEIEEIRCK
jgi:hypothetical protein